MPTTIEAALAVRDLTGPASPPHAIQLIAEDVIAAVHADGGGELLVHRGDRVVDVADNYDRLGYPPGAAARDARHTRYAGPGRMLRSQTSALVPGVLRGLARAATGTPDVLVACPGIVYRRDRIDRLHAPMPHQLDLWRIGARRRDLRRLVAVAMAAALPGVAWRVNAARHPYTTGGLEIEARSGDRWVEVGECGRAAGHVLAGAGLDPVPEGLALGLGLDRLVMVRKGIADIRLLRAGDPRVAAQMGDLAPYRPVPAHPASRRDVSVVAPAGITAEELGDRVREALGPDAVLVEEVALLAATPAEDLPETSRRRLGIRPGEVNALVRIVLHDLRGVLPGERANRLRDRVLAALTRSSEQDPAERPGWREDRLCDHGGSS